MEIEFIDYKYNENELSFTIKDKEINGILGKDYHDLVNIIKLKKDYHGTVNVNGDKLSKEEIIKYNRKISIVPYEFEYNSFCETICDLMKYEIKRKLSHVYVIVFVLLQINGKQGNVTT